MPPDNPVAPVPLSPSSTSRADSVPEDFTRIVPVAPTAKPEPVLGPYRLESILGARAVATLFREASDDSRLGDPFFSLANGLPRVIRGGSVFHPVAPCRRAVRNDYSFSDRRSSIGFRVALPARGAL